jgi:hypothetical protein
VCFGCIELRALNCIEEIRDRRIRVQRRCRIFFDVVYRCDKLAAYSLDSHSAAFFRVPNAVHDDTAGLVDSATSGV